MAAYFDFHSEDTQFGELHVNCPHSVRDNLHSRWQDCIAVQVDGDELTLALAILGRKEVPHRVFTFILEEAQMICVNWK